MSLNTAQTAFLAELYENDADFRKVVDQRVKAAAEEAEKRAAALRSFGGDAAEAPAKPAAKRGRPKGSKNKVPAAAASGDTAASNERPDWKPKIMAALKGSKNGLLVKEIQEKISKNAGVDIPGGTLNTYIYGMKKENIIKGEGNRGKTRYSLVG